jgi:hypothetical protein
VLSPFGAARPPVGLEQDSTHVVLVEQGWFHIIPLHPPPKNVERVIHEYVDRKKKDTLFTTNLL